MKVKLLEDQSTKDSTVSALNFSTSATESDGSGIDDFGLRFSFKHHLNDKYFSLNSALYMIV